MVTSATTIKNSSVIKSRKKKFLSLSVLALTSASVFFSPSIAMAATEPIVPTTNDTCGVENDTTNLPFSPDISWERFTSSGRDYVSGTVSTNGQLSQTFYALPSLSGDTFPDGSTEKSYTFNFTDESCNIVVEVEAFPPIFTDNFGSADDTYTIPSATGNAYFINNDSVAPGTYAVTDPNMVVILHPMPGYSFADGTQTQYLGNFTSNPITPDIPIDPYTPDFIDMSGTANDVYMIPADSRVTYLIDGVPVAAGSYPANGTVTITIKAEPGYVLNDPANSSYEYTYSAEITDFTLAYPASVTRSDQPGKSKDTYTVPSSVGVEYVMNGKVIEAGTYQAEGNVIIDAQPMSGYRFFSQADTRFDYTFSNEVQFSKPFVVGGNTIFIPEIEGLEYSLNGVVTPWGYYDIMQDSTVTVRAVAGFSIAQGTDLSYDFTFIPNNSPDPVTPVEPVTPVTPVDPGTPTVPQVPGTNIPGVVDQATTTDKNGLVAFNNAQTGSNESSEDELANTAFVSKPADTTTAQNNLLLGFGGLIAALGSILLRTPKRHKV